MAKYLKVTINLDPTELWLKVSEFAPLSDDDIRREVLRAITFDMERHDALPEGVVGIDADLTY
jgi:hypothetical protein